ncbi:MAG: TolC family protein [Mediterranea sp.]|nr:TolC family protein [Mediterranea sp.]
MRRTFMVFVCCLSVLAGHAQLTLKQCQELAQQNYPLVKRYDLIAQAREYNLSNASKGYLPQFTLSGKATYQSDVTKLPVDFDALGKKLGMAIDVPTLNKGQYSVALEVDQNIYDGGHVRSQQKLAHAEADIDQGRQEVDMYALRRQVNQLYFGILLLDEQLRQNTLLAADLERTHQQVSAYIKNGIASQADIDAVSVEILSTQQQRVGLEASRTAYLQMLSLFVGKELSGNTLEMPTDRPVAHPFDNHRPELRLFDAQAAQLGAQNAALNARLRPSLGAFVQGAYGNPGIDMLKSKPSAYYVAGLRLSWNFGALYTRRNDLRLIDNARQQIAISRDVFLFNTRLQSTQEQSTLASLRKQMRDDDEVIRLRGNVRKAAEAKVANGTMTVTDLLRDITAENLARNTKATHRVQLLKQLYDWNDTMGN